MSDPDNFDDRDDFDAFIDQMAPTASERRDAAVDGCFKTFGIMLLVFIVCMAVVISLTT